MTKQQMIESLARKEQELYEKTQEYEYYFIVTTFEKGYGYCEAMIDERYTGNTKLQNVKNQWFVVHQLCEQFGICEESTDTARFYANATYDYLKK